MTKTQRALLLLTTTGLALSAPAAAADKKAKASSKGGDTIGSMSASGTPAAEEVDVNAIKEKYWARGDENELGVVQNRLYSKARKWELIGFYAMPSSDPFLSMRAAGGSLGFHFTEYFKLQMTAFKYFVKDSDPASKLASTTGAVAATNRPSSFMGVEAVGSVLYGKLSVLGKKIIYYDLHLAGGLGVTKNEKQTAPTPTVGIGQKIYISQRTSILADYRLHYYKEDIIEKTLISKKGQVIGSRSNFTNTFFIGISFLIGKDDNAQPEEKKE